MDHGDPGPSQSDDKKMNLRLKPSLEQEVAEQLDLGAELSDAFLNPETGEIVRIHEWSAKDEWNRPKAESLRLIPTVPSQETYLWMVEFTDTVKDLVLADRLKVSLKEIGAYWKFKNILYHAPAEELQWNNFNRGKLIAAAQEWLRSA